MKLLRISLTSLYMTAFAFPIIAGPTFFPENYTMPQGEKAKGFQMMIETKYQSAMRDAFEAAAKLLPNQDNDNPLHGLTVVDYGCGIGLSAPHIQALIGDEGKYIGVDALKTNIDYAVQNYDAKYMFILGDQNEHDVKIALADADIVFMRMVSMYQRIGTHVDFFNEIASLMKPGAILIDTEVSPTGNQKKFISRYPGIQDLFDHKAEMEKRKLVNYDFASQEYAVLTQVFPVVLQRVADDIVHMREVLPRLQVFVKSVLPGEVRNDYITADRAEALTKIVNALPSGPNDFWSNGSVFTHIARKAVEE